MIFKELQHKGVFEVRLEVRHDARGFFARAYDDKLFEAHGIHKNWVQENQSFSAKKGTMRGLHFQCPPHAEAKFVRMFGGEAFFAFVDLRKGSETFGKWESVILSEEAKNMLFVPRGFALGVCTLTDNCTLYYKMDNYYAPEAAETLKWDDKDLAIVWPNNEPSSISEKDAHGKSFREFLDTRGGLEV